MLRRSISRTADGVSASARAEHFATIERYCTDCHNNAEMAGGTSFEGAAIE